MKEYMPQADNSHNRKQNTQQHCWENNFDILSIVEQLMSYCEPIQVLVFSTLELHLQQ